MKLEPLGCIHPGCGKLLKTRGLCDSHLNELKRLVAAGDKTWEQLENEGRSKPAKRTPFRGRIREDANGNK